MLSQDEIEAMRHNHVPVTVIRSNETTATVCRVACLGAYPCDAAKLLPELDRRDHEIQDLECELLIQYGRHPKRVEDCPSCSRGMRPVPEKKIVQQDVAPVTVGQIPSWDARASDDIGRALCGPTTMEELAR